MKKPINFEQRFWSQVEETETCWLWKGSLTKAGYGQATRYGEPIRAHRFSWELHHGPIPDGLFVCHKCDVRNCCRPTHLFLGTAEDNAQDMSRKGRSTMHFLGVTDENHPKAKLTRSQVEEIKRALASGPYGTATKLAKTYGVSKGCISQIAHGKRRQFVA